MYTIHLYTHYLYVYTHYLHAYTHQIQPDSTAQFTGLLLVAGSAVSCGSVVPVSGLAAVHQLGGICILFNGERRGWWKCGRCGGGGPLLVREQESVHVAYWLICLAVVIRRPLSGLVTSGWLFFQRHVHPPEALLPSFWRQPTGRVWSLPVSCNKTKQTQVNQIMISRYYCHSWSC